MIGRVDDDLVLLLGDGNRLLVIWAGAFLAGELIVNAKTLAAAWTRNLNGHVGK